MSGARGSDPRFDHADDRECIAAVRRGDATAFEAVFRAYYDRLVHFAQFYVLSRDSAEEIVQDVLFRVWEHRDRLPEHDTIRAYLYASTRNRAVDHVRRSVVEQRGLRWLLGSAHDVSAAEELERPDTSLELSELDAAIQHAIAQLPDRCRQTYLLHREHGLTHAQIADAMGVSPKTVQVQMGRALQAIRRAAGPFLSIVGAVLSIAR